MMELCQNRPDVAEARAVVELVRKVGDMLDTDARTQSDTE